MSRNTSKGIPPRMLGGLGKGRAVGDDSPAIDVGVPFVIQVQTASGTSSYDIYDANCPRKLRVLWAFVTLTAAPDAGDTFVINNDSTAITDTMNVAVYADTDQIAFSQVSDASMDISKNGTLNVTTAGDAVGLVTIWCCWVD